MVGPAHIQTPENHDGFSSYSDTRESWWIQFIFRHQNIIVDSLHIQTPDIMVYSVQIQTTKIVMESVHIQTVDYFK